MQLFIPVSFSTLDTLSVRTCFSSFRNWFAIFESHFKTLLAGDVKTGICQEPDQV